MVQTSAVSLKHWI